jgi:two-component system, cell cycle sensor histidine kinase and response regulator CckA
MTSENGLIEVLLVEDDEEDYLLTKDQFGMIEGSRYAIQWVSDRRSAVEAIHDRDFDVCLVDYRLGPEDGIELVRALVADGHDLPMIVMTGQGDLKVDVEAARAGAADYLVKGEASPALLERTIRYAMRSRADVRALRESEAQLRQAQKMEAIGLLAGGVAHDFNNQLLAIRGYGELVRSMPKDTRADDWLNEILKAADQAAALTKQLLTFSRRQISQPRQVNLNDVVADTRAMLDRLLAERVEIVAALAAELGTVKVDPGQVNQVLVNLAVNARDAMPNGGRLTIETQNVVLDEEYAREHLGALPGRYAMLAVTDTGVGMDKETASRIFEPFYTTKAEGQGTGLGLSTVYGIVTQAQGYISVYSEPDRGTVFRIYLPLVDAPADSVALDPVPSHQHRVGGRILVVDDDAAVRGVLATMLHQHGYEAEVVADASEAFSLCETTQFDLLLTDMVTPALDGRQIAEGAVARQPGICVLYMSGYMPRTLQHSLPDDANFLAKPFTTLQLVAALDAALECAAVSAERDEGLLTSH